MRYTSLMISAALLWCAGLVPAQGEDVEILRDPWGIPHVFADTDAGAFYGLGYATAEDRAFQMTYSLRIIQGRLAEVIGDVRQINRNDTVGGSRPQDADVRLPPRRAAHGEPPGPGNARPAAGLLRRGQCLFPRAPGPAAPAVRPNRDCSPSRGRPPIAWRRGGTWDSSSPPMARGI